MKLFKNIEKFKNNIFFIEKNKKTYYRDFLKFEKKFKNFKSKKLALITAYNSSEFLKIYLTFLRKDIVIMLVDYDINLNDLSKIINTYKPYYIFLRKSSNINLRLYKIVNELDENNIFEIKKEIEYKIFKDLSLLLTTSGSTGSKKFVRISKKNLYYNTKSICKYLKIKNNHRTITTLPPNYTYGLSILNTHIYAGASICLNQSSFLEKNFWEIANKYKVNNFGGVPFHFEILKKLKFSKNKIRSLKYITQAGGSLDIQTKKYFANDAKKNNYKFIIMYGQVEATSRISYLPFEKLQNKIESVGVAIPEGSINIHPKTKEIIYKGPNVSLGYAVSYKDLHKGDKNKGILNTGDLGKIDSDGYLEIVGRRNRDIKLFGHRVNLDEIENILKNKGFNNPCIGKNNKLFIFVIKNKNKANILNYLSKKLKIHSTAFKLVKLSQYPLNTAGKISYTSLGKSV